MTQRTPLFRPQEYFSSKNSTRAIATGIGVLILTQIGFAITTQGIVGVFLEELPQELESARFSGPVNFVIFASIVSTIISVFVYAAILNYVGKKSSKQDEIFSTPATPTHAEQSPETGRRDRGKQTGSSGRFGDALGVSAWAQAPALFSYPLTYLYIRWKVSTLDLANATNEEVLAEFEQLATGGEPVIMGIQIAVIVWSVYILGYGISGSHDATLFEPLAVAGILGFLRILLLIV